MEPAAPAASPGRFVLSQGDDDFDGPGPGDAGAAVARFDAFVARLRRDCPWDAEQSHESLRRHLLEESYEVLEAIDALDPDDPATFSDLEEELGDLLFQVVLHARLATESGHFDLAAVANGSIDKLRDRHPHVFGASATSDAAAVDADAAGIDVDQVLTNWEALKKAEKGRNSVLDGMPAALPALLLAAKTQKKAASIGIEPGALFAAIADQPDGSDDDRSFGLALFALVAQAREAGVDPEDALRLATLQAQAHIRATE
ncbi:MAG: nucleoside triphosphate pyrophosphohydrolase [Acidimicrobiales bacterium]|nr:nucleoside triphosphate pyrophosphohydrolase [Acidimicrobiales bacterium]